jgi:hypothetical protein
MADLNLKYTVQPGDTLWELADWYHTTPEAIEAGNPGIKPENLTVGQVIEISAEQTQEEQWPIRGPWGPTIPPVVSPWGYGPYPAPVPFRPWGWGPRVGWPRRRWRRWRRRRFW